MEDASGDIHVYTRAPWHIDRHYTESEEHEMLLGRELIYEIAKSQQIARETNSVSLVTEAIHRINLLIQAPPETVEQIFENRRKLFESRER